MMFLKDGFITQCSGVSFFEQANAAAFSCGQFAREERLQYHGIHWHSIYQKQY
jgi:hypothetical protein